MLQGHSSVERPASWKLTDKEVLLVRAALCRGPISIQAWRELSSEDDLDGFGRGAIGLFPELYLSLRAQGIDHPLLPRLKGIYKHTWASNQVMFAQTKGILLEFKRRQISSILLKGAALVVQHYGDFGRRFMRDVDLLVPYEQAALAFNALLKLNWQPREHVPEPLPRLFTSKHAVCFGEPAGVTCLDLHWNALHLALGPRADTAFWEGRVPMKFLGVDAFALNSTDQLLQVLAHAYNWWVPSPVCWVRDALTIIRSGEYPIDWERLEGTAERHGITLGVSDRLQYLHRQFDVGVPTWVRSRGKVSLHQRVESWSYSRRLPYTPIELCLVALMVFLRLPWEFWATHGILALPRFLQYGLGVSRLRDLPSVFFGLMRNMRRLRKAGRDFSTEGLFRGL